MDTVASGKTSVSLWMCDLPGTECLGTEHIVSELKGYVIHTLPWSINMDVQTLYVPYGLMHLSSTITLSSTERSFGQGDFNHERGLRFMVRQAVAISRSAYQVAFSHSYNSFRCQHPGLGWSSYSIGRPSLRSMARTPFELPPVTHIISSDGSTQGWGGHLIPSGDQVSGQWPELLK